MNARRQPWRRRKAASGFGAIFFFLVFIGGAAGILMLKQAGVGQIGVTAVPCGLLFLYAAIVKFLPYFRLREDQAGDNCYYLGFLFTLFSLSLALIAFVEAGGTEEIVEDFGIALSSTIIGLALRVMFTQMRQDPIDIEREARAELAQAAQRLRASLDQSVVEMNSFSRSTQQSIADGLEELDSKVATVLERSLRRYDEATGDWVERIERTITTFSTNAEHINRTTKQTISACEALSERIEAIKAPEDLVDRALAPAVTEVDKIVVTLREREEKEARAYNQLRELIEASIGAVTDLDGRMKAVAELLNGCTSFVDTLGTAERRVDALTTGLENAGKAANDTGDDLRRAVAEPAREVSAALSSVAKHTVALGEIEMRLNTLSRALEEHIATIELIRQERSTGKERFGLWRR